MTIAEAIAKAAARLAAHRIESSRLDAELLLCHVLQKDRAWLVAHFPDRLSDSAAGNYNRMLDRRAVREPLQYITETQEFRGGTFRVTPDVLIPRPETELVVEEAIMIVKEAAQPVIVDLCTGSGCIAVSCAQEIAGATIFATDLSPAAIEVARENARRHNTADRIRFFEGDLFEPLAELNLKNRADVITANPPYIRTGELATLQPEVRDFEPELALLAGPRGTEVAERILLDAPAFLKSGGSLVMEMGMGQADALAAAAHRIKAYAAVRVLKDLAGIERVITAVKK